MRNMKNKNRNFTKFFSLTTSVDKVDFYEKNSQWMKKILNGS